MTSIQDTDVSLSNNKHGHHWIKEPHVTTSRGAACPWRPCPCPAEGATPTSMALTRTGVCSCVQVCAHVCARVCSLLHRHSAECSHHCQWFADGFFFCKVDFRSYINNAHLPSLENMCIFVFSPNYYTDCISRQFVTWTKVGERPLSPKYSRETPRWLAWRLLVSNKMSRAKEALLYFYYEFWLKFIFNFIK